MVPKAHNGAKYTLPRYDTPDRQRYDMSHASYSKPSGGEHPRLTASVDFLGDECQSRREIRFFAEYRGS